MIFQNSKQTSFLSIKQFFCIGGAAVAQRKGEEKME
jgi:hypothetical protein